MASRTPWARRSSSGGKARAGEKERVCAIASNYLGTHQVVTAECAAKFSGLIKHQDLGQSRIRLALVPVTGKVSLEDSPTYRRLAAEREGGVVR